MSHADGSLLLVLPLQYRRVNGQVEFEKQAANGLALWADHFSKLTVACPVIPASAKQPDRREYVPASEIRNIDRIKFLDLPYAYGPLAFARTKGAVAKLLAQEIDQHQYLSFALGGWLGDWGTVASNVAAKKKRNYSVWTDRVEHEVFRVAAKTGPLKKRVRNALIWRPTMWAHHRAIRKSSLGLFHGRDCFDAYKAWSREPHLVHNIHIKVEDRLSEPAMAAKRESVLQQRPLNIVYAGRASAMKGPLDWVAALTEAARLGVDFHATWLGDGEDLPAMKSAAASLGDRVSFPGFVGDRIAVLDALRAADLLLFCHKTPESPRVLIESLLSGTPIVGYDAPFPADLIEHHAGGLLTPINQPAQLAQSLATLHADRAKLSDLIHRAWLDSEPFNDEAVFEHRSKLIKQFA